MRKQATVTKSCTRCECTIEVVPNGLYCKPCQKIIKVEQCRESHIRMKELKRAGKRDFVLREIPSLFISSITDEMQKALNLAIDVKHAVPMTIKIYTAEEILLVAGQITPLRYIRSGRHEKTTYLDAEPSGRMKLTRLESSGEI